MIGIAPRAIDHGGLAGNRRAARRRKFSGKSGSNMEQSFLTKRRRDGVVGTCGIIP
jgi:hypothetical protein